MKRTKIVFLILFSSVYGFSQESFTLSMNAVPDKIERSKTQKVIYALSLESKDIDKALFKDFTVSVKPDCNIGTLPQTEFKVDFKDCTLDKVSDGYAFYLTILANPNLDKERTIKLDIKISSTKDSDLTGIKNMASVISRTITIKPIELDSALDQFNYLAYIGTNFDLVDGVKTSNLFFASNIYKLPSYDDDANIRDFGFNLTIYGNRAITLTENYGLQDYEHKYVRIPNTDSTRVFRNQGDLTKSIVSDNLGLVLSTLVKWPNLGEENRTLRVHLAPQIEFAFRRFTETSNYTNIVVGDSSMTKRYRGSDLVIKNRETETSYINSYDLNISPLSFFFTHETENISVRLNLATGYPFRFRKDRLSDTALPESYNPITSSGNIFYGARLWITEAISGVTLAGEVSNRLKKGDNQPFFNVTLSKALSFKNIGSIFAPITAR